MNNKNIQNIISNNKLGTIKDIELFDSSQNRVYKVTTDKGIFVIKEFSKDAIGNYYYLKKRKEQIRISNLLNKKGIFTVVPISFNKSFFQYLNNHYYLIYNFVEEKPLKKEELTIEHIKKLATIQSRIHKLNIKNTLTCSYKNIKIDLVKQLNVAKKVSNDLYHVLDSNKNILEEIINNCNNKTKIMKNNLCISHNDYKLLNILWKINEVKLIDFDAMGLSNPTCSLCESAYTFSKNPKSINYDFYKEYLEAYIKEYGPIKENYLDALYASFNGKLQWLSYMFSKNYLKKNNYIDETISMINELVTYYNNVDRFNGIYLKIINK
ncbi:MAG: phosphotransferase [Bacilli bacterium]|nr:phosphotransferase [Bacilli bacterium]